MSRIGGGMLSSALGVGGETISGLNAAAGLFARKQINPYVEVLYRGTNLRAFRFSFVFAPQSRTDSMMLYGTGQGTGLLNRFRHHAAPEISGVADLLFNSPSEWEIDFL